MRTVSYTSTYVVYIINYIDIRPTDTEETGVFVAQMFTLGRN